MVMSKLRLFSHQKQNASIEYCCFYFSVSKNSSSACNNLRAGADVTITYNLEIWADVIIIHAHGFRGHHFGYFMIFCI